MQNPQLRRTHAASEATNVDRAHPCRQGGNGPWEEQKDSGSSVRDGDAEG